jgi:hypothetical protein
LAEQAREVGVPGEFDRVRYLGERFSLRACYYLSGACQLPWQHNFRIILIVVRTQKQTCSHAHTRTCTS